MQKFSINRHLYLLVATFIVAIVGLVYELIASTVSSYLLGDSIRQFSLVIGVFMTSMGVGSWLSRYVDDAINGFIYAQIILALVGGFSAPLIFLAFAYVGQISLLLFIIVILIGILCGLEIPLVIKILESEASSSQFNLSNVLTVDYLGALIAAILFPTVIIPQLGLVSASLLFGLINLLVAGGALFVFKNSVYKKCFLLWMTVFVLMLSALVHANKILSFAEAKLYQDDVILAEDTPYQRIVVTATNASTNSHRVRLFLNGAIQFDSLDEYRYHESLVHPAMQIATQIEKILILGGGDGMAAREVLKYPVKQVDLVDLDSRVTELFTKTELAKLNDKSLSNHKVTVYNEDAWLFLRNHKTQYDVIIADLPDPNRFEISKLYSLYFYNLLAKQLSAGGVFVTQSGSPTFANKAFWCINKTLLAVGNPTMQQPIFNTVPYHTYVPSFGDWGFIMATSLKKSIPRRALPADLRYYSEDNFMAMQIFSSDAAETEVEVNKMNSHILVQYYEEGWSQWF